MTISENIFRLIRLRGMTQKEFAERTNIGESTISDWKRKKTNPGADKIMVICEVLNVSPEELLSGGMLDQSNQSKGRKPKNYVIDIDSEVGRVVTAYMSMDDVMKARIRGYYEALKSGE